MWGEGEGSWSTWERGLEYMGEGGWSTWERGWSTWEKGVGVPGRGCWYKGVRDLRQSLDTPQAPEGLREHVWIQSKREFSKRARIEESEKDQTRQV